jgi:Purine catabolism regulatory protein-like family/PucR C-terminal helix-turn-helix domain/GGDEF-like domain
MPRCNTLDVNYAVRVSGHAGVVGGAGGIGCPGAAGGSGACMDEGAGMRLRALLESAGLGLRLLAGGDELDRAVRGVMTTDLRDPSRYLGGGELVLTGLAWRHGPGDSERFVRILAAAGVAALAAGEAELGAVPQDLVDACARHRLPLFAVDERVAFASITEHVSRQVSVERTGDLAALVERHRRLMSSGPEGGGADAVLALLSADLDLRAHVLSPTGRQIAGVAPGLPAGTGPELAGGALAAARGGRPGPYRAVVGGRSYSVFPVRQEAAGAGPADWMLAVEADCADWPAHRLDLVHGVARLVAVERERQQAARAVPRRLAQDVLDLVRAGASPGEVAARLRVAGPVLLPGAGTVPRWQVVVAHLEWDGPACVQPLLEEILAGPDERGPVPPHLAAVAHDGEEAVALVPLPPGAAGSGAGAGSASGFGSGSGAGSGSGSGGELPAARLLEAARGPLGRALADGGRLTIGVSAAVHSAEGLRGALEEARHARRVAAARGGRVCVAGHEELASHVLLLPFVPDDVRRAFTARLLEPLREYDRRHRAGLVPTLEAFLDCDGSWTRCSARLHLHVNTLRYRVGRIEQLTGRDLSRLEDKLDFFLALRMS